MPKLHLIRHGEPSRTGVMLGAADPPLSPAGKAAAMQILIDPPAGRIFSSPLLRAGETAYALARGAPVTEIAAFREIDLGAWNGLSWDELTRRYPSDAAEKLNNWLEVSPPDGESWSAFCARVLAGLALVRDSGVDSVIVAHAGVNACIAAEIAGVDPLCFRQNYCQVLTYELPD
jgi:alpha-ribazole phosphatase